MARLAAIVLAAGRSSRMGELKPLLPLGDGTVLERALGSFREVGIDDLRVVVGWHADEVAAVAAGLGVATVVNDDWQRGMFSSVAVGVASLGADVEELFLLPADCALVRAETIGRLARAALAQARSDALSQARSQAQERRHPAPVVYPVHEGRRGHPPLIARGALPVELGKEPAGGLRGLLAACDATALEVDIDDPGVLLDMDLPSHYQRARDYVAAEDIPDKARCLDLLREAGVPQTVVLHSLAVAGVAAGLTARLNACELHLNARLVSAAALLHDIARAGHDHARAGDDHARSARPGASRGRPRLRRARTRPRRRELLGDLGYRRVAAVTVRHMDLPHEALGTPDEAQPLPDEAQIVYLADKLVQGAQVVALQERLDSKLDDLCGDPDAQTHARARLGRAFEVARRVESLIGEPAEAVARRALA